MQMLLLICGAGDEEYVIDHLVGRWYVYNESLFVKLFRSRSLRGSCYVLFCVFQ